MFVICRHVLRGARQLLPAAGTRSPSRGIWNWMKEVDPDFMVRLQKDYDVSLQGLAKYMQKKQRQNLIESHSYDREVHKQLGSDLMAAYFVLVKGGSIKFKDHGSWLKAEKDKELSLPSTFDPSYQLEAVDVSNIVFFYQSFENLVGLDHLKYLNLSGGQLIDDWCMDYLVELRDTLLYLDVSGCPKVTGNGLAALHKLSKLKRLRMRNMAGVEDPANFLLMLEDMLPHVVIDTDIDLLASPAQPDTPPAFLQDQDLQSLPGKVCDLQLTWKS